MATEQSTLLKTALRIIDGYNRWDVDAILAPWAPGCTQRVYPSRLAQPLQTKETYREWFASIQPLFKSFHVTILDTVEDPVNNKVTFHAIGEGETVIGPYANESMLIMQMTSDHQQLLNFKEFVDSGFIEDFFATLRKNTSKQQQD